MKQRDIVGIGVGVIAAILEFYMKLPVGVYICILTAVAVVAGLASVKLFGDKDFKL